MKLRSYPSFSVVVGAGVVGGLAEVAWILAYAATTSFDSTALAREVTRTVLPGREFLHAAVIGVSIHLFLSIGLAVAISSILRVVTPHPPAPWATIAISISALCAVWALNFFVILPQLNPQFVSAIPYTVSFVSKLAFGITMGLVLVLERMRTTRSSILPVARRGVL